MIFVPNFNPCYFPQDTEHDFVQLRGSSHLFSIVSYPGFCRVEDCIKIRVTNTKEFQRNGRIQNSQKRRGKEGDRWIFLQLSWKVQKINRHHITRCVLLWKNCEIDVTLLLVKFVTIPTFTFSSGAVQSTFFHFHVRAYNSVWTTLT